MVFVRDCHCGWVVFVGRWSLLEMVIVDGCFFVERWSLYTGPNSLNIQPADPLDGINCKFYGVRYINLSASNTP